MVGGGGSGGGLLHTGARTGFKHNGEQGAAPPVWSQAFMLSGRWQGCSTWLREAKLEDSVWRPED